MVVVALAIWSNSALLPVHSRTYNAPASHCHRASTRSSNRKSRLKKKAVRKA